MVQIDQIFGFQWAEIDRKYTRDCSPMESDLTLARLSFQCQMEVQNCRLGGHFQKCFHTAARSNQLLHIFSQFSLIVLIMPRPTHIDIGYEVLALACEGMQKIAVAGRVGVTRATVYYILQKHAAIGTLVPGKSKGDPLKTTRRQDHALFGMVWQDRFICARALTAWMRNLYGMRAGRKTINNQFLSHSYRVYGPTRKPCWLPTSANLPQ